MKMHEANLIGIVKLHYICILVAMTMETCYCLTKQWTVTTDVGNKDRWSNGRLPCANSHVQFPADLHTAVYIQNNLTVQEVVLPVNGELVMGEGATLLFPAQVTQEEACPDTDAIFLEPEAESWFNPNAWCIASHAGGDCQAVQPTLLHTERVPCRGDAVGFPDRLPFLVNLESGVDITVATITIHSQAYTTGTLHAYMSSTAGTKAFRRSNSGAKTTITVHGNVCTDAAGCVCGNDRPPLRDKICETVTECPNITCSQPLEPRGHCCPVCGGIIKGHFLDGFKMAALRQGIEDIYMHESGADSVQMSLSRQPANGVQVVIWDNSNPKRAVQVARQAADQLQRDVKSAQRYKMAEITLYTSDLDNTPKSSAFTGEKFGGIGSIVGIILSVILVLLLIGLAMFCLMDRKRRRLPNILKNFGRGNKSDDLELDRVTFDNTTEKDGFDNPMYGTVSSDTGIAEGGLVLDPKTLKSTTSDANDNYNAGFDNPMFGQGPTEEIIHSGPILLDSADATTVTHIDAESNI